MSLEHPETAEELRELLSRVARARTRSWDLDHAGPRHPQLDEVIGAVLAAVLDRLEAS